MEPDVGILHICFYLTLIINSIAFSWLIEADPPSEVHRLEGVPTLKLSLLTRKTSFNGIPCLNKKQLSILIKFPLYWFI